MSRERPKKSSKTFHRRRVGALVVVLAFALSGLVAWQSVRYLEATSSSSEGLEARSPTLLNTPLSARLSAPAQRDLTLAGDAYTSVAGELPGVSPEDIEYVQESVEDPSLAAVWLPAPERKGRERHYVVFLSHTDETWRPERSVLVGDEAFPKDIKTLLTDLPEDLVNPLFPPDDPPAPKTEPGDRAVQEIKSATGDKKGWEAEGPVKSRGGFHRVKVSKSSKPDGEDGDVSTQVYLRERNGALQVAGIGADLTSAELPGFPAGLVKSADAAFPKTADFGAGESVYEPEKSERSARVRKGMDLASKAARDYPGVVGFYAIDLKSGDGYGVRPGEEFFSASTIKVAVMAAVYEEIDAGDLEYSDKITTTSEDWASGAGWLQWNTPGAKSTVEDALWLMMTQSDNVATNALVRKVGGPERIDEEARTLGAKDTRLFWKLSSERAAVPSLDNRTTPRDMAKMLSGIYKGQGFSDYARREMVGLMEQNNLEYWMEAGVPNGVKTANKGGWLDTTYNDVGVVEYGERPYALATFTKYGTNMQEGGELLAEVSKGVWLAESGETKKEYESGQRPGDSEGGKDEPSGPKNPKSGDQPADSRPPDSRPPDSRPPS